MKETGGYSEQLKRNLRRVFWVYFALFALLAGHIVKFVAADSRDIARNPANPRIAYAASEITRGAILDAKGDPLAISGEDSGRTYPYGPAFAHVVGYASHGRAGVEAKYNLVLQTLSMETLQRVNNVITGKPLTGNSVVLTADAGLQRLAADALGQRRGAVVALEPSTGRVLAMASYPAFDPNSLAEDWDALAADSGSSPLLNRAAQGLYPPGSVFKIVTAAASRQDYESFTYACGGEAWFGSKRIRCFNGKAHGSEDIVKAFTVSCNTFFSTAGMDAGGAALAQAAEGMWFNRDIPFPLEHSRSSFVAGEGTGETEIVETAIGQGKTLATPLHMALVASAVANGGVMMEPYVVDHVLTPFGGVKDKQLPVTLTQALTLEQADFIKDMMVSAVENGTGAPAAIPGVSVAGKTGTAENASGDDHGWFVAFAPADKPKVAVAVVLENSGGPKQAMPIAKQVMEYVLAEE